MRRIVFPRAKHLPRLGRLLAAGMLAFAQFVGGMHVHAAAQPSDSGCQLEQIAFCDTFDVPSPNGDGTRSGDLDGVIWGVSRATSVDNPPQGQEFSWNSSRLNLCGTPVTVAPPRDIQICNGHLVESVNDGGAQTVLAMYPKQPFDFAGRTGKVVFDVSNDTAGNHMAWPEFVVTDQPVPAPFEDAAGVANYARNSFGIQFSAACRNGALVQNTEGDSWTVNSMFITSNYAFHSQDFALKGCVKRAPDQVHLNHIEISISPSHVEVWASDPGDRTLKQLAAADIAMPLTRGLVWMEEAHYNADKFDGNQANHTFAWDNFGFDGPVLPRDLGFDVLDATHNGTTGGNLGYFVAPGQTSNFQLPNVHDVENASAALLEFTWWPHQPGPITYSVNGNQPHTASWPYGNQVVTYKSNTLAVPVPLGELVNGANAITLSSTQRDGVSVANIDLILVAAGGIPTSSPVPGVVPPPSIDPGEVPPPPDSAPSDAPPSALVETP